MNSKPSQSLSADTSPQDKDDLWRLVSEMKSELESYKAEVAALRQEVTIKEAKEAGLTYHPVSSSSRRTMLKRMAAGAAGLSALSLAAIAGSNTVFAEDSSATAIDATAGTNGYGGNFTSTFAQLRLVPAGALPTLPGTAPANHNLGELFVDSTGALYYSVSTTGGATPNAWRKLAGSSTAGALTLLQPNSDRLIDTRPGSTVPTGGRNTPLPATGSGPGGTTYSFQIGGTAGREGGAGQIVPVGATAIMGNITLIPSVAGSAAIKLLPSSVTDTSKGTAVVVAGSSIISNSYSAALGSDGVLKVAVIGSGSYDLILDVVGYFV